MLRAMLNRLTVQRFARSLNMPVLNKKRHCCAHFAQIRFIFAVQRFEQHSAQPLTFRVNNFYMHIDTITRNVEFFFPFQIYNITQHE